MRGIYAKGKGTDVLVFVIIVPERNVVARPTSYTKQSVDEKNDELTSEKASVRLKVEVANGGITDSIIGNKPYGPKHPTCVSCFYQ